MKSYIYIGMFCLFSINIYAQKGDTKVDTRIDNMAYWIKLINQGIVKPTPKAPVPPSVYRGSQINSPLINLPNSQDVLIDNTSGYTESENSVDINPTNILKALNSNNAIVINQPSDTHISEFTTVNQGINWSGNVNPLNSSLADPATAISNDNHYYLGFIDQVGNQVIAVSTDEGTTWQTYIVDPTANDKGHITVNKAVSSQYVNNVYVAWTKFLDSSPYNRRISFSRSQNSGATWSTPLNISAASAGTDPTSFDQGVNLQTGSDGDVYAVWAIYDTWIPSIKSDENAIGFAHSDNGGVSFFPSIRAADNIRGTRKTRVDKGIRTFAYPSMAVDNSFGPNRGTIYVVWPNVGIPGVNTGTDVDVYLIKSTDKGVNWTSPQKVNTSTPGQGKKHFSPWITCDQTNGKLHIIYYDDRNVSATDCETWMSSSFDGGNIWSDYKISDVSFTPVPISGDYFGDYLGVTANNDIIYPVWTDNRTPPGYALTYTSPLISSDFCPLNLTLQNITIPVAGTYKYRAQNDINVANNGTIFTLQGNSITGARASMVAGGDITLYDNTTVELGATLTIVPGPCNSPILKPTFYDPKNKSELLQLKEFDIASNINLYPNPVNNILYLELSDEFQKKKNLTYEIKGLMMNTLQKGNIREKFTQINTERLLTGGYIICVYENNVLLETKKIIKL